MLHLLTFHTFISAFATAYGGLIQTRDGKFLCHGTPYTTFPNISDTTEIIECPFQCFKEFGSGTFRNKEKLLRVDFSNGCLETLNKDTFKGAVSLQSINLFSCKIQGEINIDTFCSHTPELMEIDLSGNPDYIFTHKPFKCLRHLTHLSIAGTIQNCNDKETAEWLSNHSDLRAVGNVCASERNQYVTSPSTQGTVLL